MAEPFDRTIDADAREPVARAGSRLEPHLSIALECDRPLASSTRHWLGAGGRVLVGRGPKRSARRGGDHRATDLELRIADPRMSSSHARLEGEHGRWRVLDAGSRNGVRVNGEPAVDRVLSPGDVIELGHTLLRFDECAADGGPLDVDAAEAPVLAPGLGTLLPSLAADFAKLARLGPTTVPILVQGETGTGKEVVAHAIHHLSGRPGRFVGVNSAAIPETLLESELFGSTRGAFSGSVADRIGLVRSADGGTFFLDEVGDLPPSSQAALLRVLQERRVRPVGGTDAVAVDLRLVSATNQDVQQLVREGRFREDLFGRIAGFRLSLPPLRERKLDLGLLVAALLPRVAGARAGTVTFSPDAARLLFEYRFPLNVRELENWLATAVALADHGQIRPEHVPDPVNLDAAPDADREDDADRPLTAEQERHREEVVALLREHRGNVSAVARAAGKGRTQIQRWLKRYALDPEDFR